MIIATDMESGFRPRRRLDLKSGVMNYFYNLSIKLQNIIITSGEREGLFYSYY